MFSVDGGIRILENVYEVSLFNLINEFENDFKIIDCSTPVCVFDGWCELALTIQKATNAFFDVLKKTKFKDLVHKKNKNIFKGIIINIEK